MCDPDLCWPCAACEGGGWESGVSIERGRGSVLWAAPPPYARSRLWLCPCLGTCTRKVTASPPSTPSARAEWTLSEGCGREGRGPGPGGEAWGRGTGLGLLRRESEEDQALVLGSTSCSGQDDGELVPLPILEQRRLRGHRSPSQLSLPSGAEPADYAGAQKWQLEVFLPGVPAEIAEPVLPVKWDLLTAPWAVTWAGSPPLPWTHVLRRQNPVFQRLPPAPHFEPDSPSGPPASGEGARSPGLPGWAEMPRTLVVTGSRPAPRPSLVLYG